MLVWQSIHIIRIHHTQWKYLDCSHQAKYEYFASVLFWDLFISLSGFVTSVTNGIFTNLQIPNSDLMSSSWNMYVYRAYEGAHVNQSTCTAMCAIDYPNQDGANCQFTQYDSNICYLGTLKGEMNVLAATNSADLHLKTCKYPKTICSWHNTT